MRNESRRMALCGVMVALGAAVMMAGGVIPVMTFCSPAIAGLTLLPVLREYGKRWALSAYVAVAALSLMLSPDKESALLFAFLGWYPVLKPRLDAIRRRPARVAAKLAVFNAAAGAMLLCVAYVFTMPAVLAEYAEMSRIMLIAFAVTANVTLLLYDRLLVIMLVLYERRLRPLIHK